MWRESGFVDSMALNYKAIRLHAFNQRSIAVTFWRDLEDEVPKFIDIDLELRDFKANGDIDLQVRGGVLNKIRSVGDGGPWGGRLRK